MHIHNAKQVVPFTLDGVSGQVVLTAQEDVLVFWGPRKITIGSNEAARGTDIPLKGHTMNIRYVDPERRLGLVRPFGLIGVILLTLVELITKPAPPGLQVTIDGARV